MIIAGVIFLAIGVVNLIMTIMIFSGNYKALYVFDLRNVKEEDRKPFSMRMGITNSIPTIAFLVAGILTLLYRNEEFLWISIIITAVSLVINIPLTLIFIKKYNGKIASN